MRGVKGHPTVRWALVMMLAVVAALSLSATPALASEDHATSLAASVRDNVLFYGAGTVVRGDLTDTDADDGGEQTTVGGQWLLLEQASQASGPWTLLYKVTAAAPPLYYEDPDYSDTYSGPVLPVQTTYYRFVFEGAPGYSASTSNVIAVGVKPLLGNPSAPASVRRGVRFTLRGTLKPAFATGAKTVTIKAYRLRGSKWVAFALAKSKATNTDYRGYTQYRLGLRLASPGRYRFKAITATTATWVGTKSGQSRTLRVR